VSGTIIRGTPNQWRTQKLAKTQAEMTINSNSSI
jgi:hypothetical protein